MRRRLLLALLALGTLATPAVASPAAPPGPAPLATCTLDLGTVTVGGHSVRLPTISYPCP